jgi:hypothetical protein
MNGRLVLKCVVVCTVSALALAASASAQWSGSIVVTNAVEPGPNGQNIGGVTAARCGNNVVVGFGDFEKGITNSTAGYAASSDGGLTFRDLGVLPASTEDAGFGPKDALGDFGAQRPVDHEVSLACAGPQLFYYATMDLADQTNCDPLCSAISVSISRDGGVTWGLPVLAAKSFFDNHFLDKPSIAVDPTSPRVYVAYLDNNFNSPPDFFFPECDSSQSVVELRLARSSDGGKTWTTSLVDHACELSTDPETQGIFGGPNVVVSPGGKVFLTYEFHPQTSPNPSLPNEIRFTRSVDQGQTFSTPLIVSKTAIDNAVPHLAVDRTSTSSRGEIYLAWAGSQTGTYTDILISESTSVGASFSFPRPLSPPPAAGAGRFQSESVLSVDNDGQVAACYYETPTNSPTSSSAYSYNCKLSSNHAATWQSQTVLGSVPVGFDALTSDFLLGADGFFTAFALDHSGTRWIVGRKADAD